MPAMDSSSGNHESSSINDLTISVPEGRISDEVFVLVSRGVLIDARFEVLIFGDVGFAGQVDWVRCCCEKCGRTAHALQPASEMVLGQKIVKTQFEEPIIMLETNVSNGIAGRGLENGGDNVWDSASTA
ncbi:hypothetical protein DKX38_025903 [Salix brachista]|uniref:Uncharacterized protein n=1 Tax=Salix brachista TaxID=2182728 RepID=A0A5N5JTZ5_9ROSI|nr:hypothetical protein DKX38_025903 [Salix brachista]